MTEPPELVKAEGKMEERRCVVRILRQPLAKCDRCSLVIAIVKKGHCEITGVLVGTLAAVHDVTNLEGKDLLAEEGAFGLVVYLRGLIW